MRPLVVCLVLLAAAPPAAQTRPPQGAKGTALIVGKVVDTRDAPVPRARVDLDPNQSWIRGTDGPQTAISVLADEDGGFFFADLPAGSYSLRATRAGYRDGELERDAGFKVEYSNVQLGAGEHHLDVLVRMTKLAVVTGTTVDESGAPWPQTYMNAYRRRIISGRPAYDYGGGMTESDERGEFRITRLEPGLYVFAATATPDVLRVAGSGNDRRVAQVMYPVTWRPRAERDGSIVPIALTDGQELSGVDFQMLPVPAVRVSGTVVGGTGSSHTLVELSRDRPVNEPAVFGQPFSISAMSDGRFVFDAVPAGVYTIRAVRDREHKEAAPNTSQQVVVQTGATTSTQSYYLPGAPDPPPPAVEPLWLAESRLVIGSDDLTDVKLTLQPGPTIGGHMVFEGVSARPKDPKYANVSMGSADATWFRHRMPARIFVAPDGRFSGDGIGSGMYVLRAQSPDGTWSLRSAMAGGRDITRTAFDVATTDLRDVVLTFTDRQTFIEGVVTGGVPSSKGPATTVLLFPTDQKLWTDYGQDSPFIMQIDIGEGRYTAEVPPGDYYAVAIIGKPAEDWTDAANFQRLSATAYRITVTEGERATLNMRARPGGR